MLITAKPAAPLARFVHVLWVVDRRAEPHTSGCEFVLPTGAMHIVLSLSGEPFRIGNGETALASTALVGGARSRPYLRHRAGPLLSAGALLRPGAGPFVLGCSAAALAERHTPLENILGAAARTGLERVASAPDSRAALRRFEQLLVSRLTAPRGMHPAVAHALERFALGEHIGEVVRRTGYSHRRFIALFEPTVGLTPKRYCRVHRFGRALARLCTEPGAGMACIAQESGYSDQAHFSREFRALGGISPAAYRRLGPSRPHHLPAHAASLPDATP